MGGLVRRDQVLVALVPILLILVAGNQIRLATSDALTPWLGGGFGMFASVDKQDTRAVRAYIETDAGPIAVNVPEYVGALQFEQRETVRGLQAMPTMERMGILADRLATMPWHDQHGVAVLEPDPDVPSTLIDFERRGRGLHADRVHVQVWRVAYQRGTATIEPQLLSEGYFDVDAS